MDWYYYFSVPRTYVFTDMSKLSIFKELWAFMRVRKKWWLLPILVMIVLLGLILIFAQGSALAPFIYTVF